MSIRSCSKMISKRTDFYRYLPNNNTYKQHLSNFINPLSPYTLPCNKTTVPSIDFTSLCNSDYRESTNVLSSQSLTSSPVPSLSFSVLSPMLSLVPEKLTPTNLKSPNVGHSYSHSPSNNKQCLKHSLSSNKRYPYHPTNNDHSLSFVTCVAPLSNPPKRRRLSHKICIKQKLSQKSSPSRLYTSPETGEEFLAVTAVPLSAAPRSKLERVVKTVSFAKLASRSQSDNFETDDLLATGDTSKLYFGVWEVPCPPVPESLRANIRLNLTESHSRKQEPLLFPLFRSTSKQHPNSPCSRSASTSQHSGSTTPQNVKLAFMESKLYESQLYRTVNPQRKCLLTSSQGSCKKVGAFPPEFRKKKKKHKKFGSPYRTTNFKSDFATACPKPPPYFKAKPRNSRSRCRDSEDRKTPWVLSKRCSKLRCFELNLSPERLFRARGSPSDNRSARGYFHTSVPERRHRMSVHEGLSTHTDLRRISNQTHISWSRSISESVINFTTQSETPPRKLPSQCSSSSPSIYGNSSTSTGERIIKLKSNNGEELFCLQKRYQKSVGNLLFCVRYAYYSFGVYLAIRNH